MDFYIVFHDSCAPDLKYQNPCLEYIILFAVNLCQSFALSCIYSGGKAKIVIKKYFVYSVSLLN